jgi:hypothetical protein
MMSNRGEGGGEHESRQNGKSENNRVSFNRGMLVECVNLHECVIASFVYKSRLVITTHTRSVGSDEGTRGVRTEVMSRANDSHRCPTTCGD